MAWHGAGSIENCCCPSMGPNPPAPQPNELKSSNYPRTCAPTIEIKYLDGFYGNRGKFPGEIAETGEAGKLGPANRFK
jgi:hypothetical protein